MNKILLALLSGFCSLCFVEGRDFINVPSYESGSIFCIRQDDSGKIWLGADKGVYSFDGYSVSPVGFGLEHSDFRVNVLEIYKGQYLIAGTDEGLYVFDLMSGRPALDSPVRIGEVKSLILSSSKLFVGASSGLYIIRNIDKILDNQTALVPDRYEVDTDPLIYSLCLVDNNLYAGGYSSVIRLTLDNGGSLASSETIGPLHGAHSLAFSEDRLLVGNFAGICEYDPDTQTSRMLANGFSKCLYQHGGKLYYGTENGLFITEDGQRKLFVHSTDDPHSIISNVVWCIYADRDGNLYFGTDCGISILPARNDVYHDISELTRLDFGNRFLCLFRDKSGTYWLGGNNGLIMSQDLSSYDSVWYRMKESINDGFPHNRIRDIFEDREGNVWVSTDAGVVVYDRNTGKFRRRSVVSADGSANSSWVYAMEEDKEGNVWLATYNQGVMVAASKDLSEDSDVSALRLFSEKDGLRDKIIDAMVYDRLSDRMLVLLHNGLIDCIDCRTSSVSHFSSGGERFSCIMVDFQGNIWACGKEYICQFGLYGGDIKKRIHVPGVGSIDFLLEVENELWAFSSEEILIISKSEPSEYRCFSTEHYISCAFYDKERKVVIAGALDGYYEFPYYFMSANESAGSFISEVYVNGVPYGQVGRIFQSHGRLVLKYDENNLGVKVGKTPFFRDDITLSYRISADGEWRTLGYGDNVINLPALRPGLLTVDLKCASFGQDIAGSQSSMAVIIKNPWYFSDIAKIIYVLTFIGIIVWTVRYFIYKSRMELERLTMEKTMHQAQMKSKFYADMSHELKTPLSMIIAPSSRMLASGTLSDSEAEAIRLIHSSALKINGLIQRALCYTSSDFVEEEYIIPSTMDFIDFARTIFCQFRDGAGDGKEFIFTSNVQSIVMDLDAVKMESVLNNLLSNACKFTADGDAVMMSLEYDNESRILDMSVSDSGEGIPAEDIPFIFQRFYRSGACSERVSGSGIGLSLVRKYVAMHDGTVEVRSKEGEGTTFLIRLPVVLAGGPSGCGEQKQEGHRSSFLVEIVEDNESIASYLSSILGKEYRCVIARNGKTGLKLCVELLPDVVIADVLMPVMNGMEMCRKIKENCMTATIPIIMLTAVNTKISELESLEIGVDEYIVKPFDVDIILSKLRQLLSTRSAMERRLRVEAISSSKPMEAESDDEKLLSGIVRVIEENIANPELNVTFLCSSLDIGEQQLRRKVKRLLNTTPVEYIKTVRLQKASLLLQQHEFNVSEVMYMVGFNNASYFSRSFAARFGMTPVQWRKKNN